MASTRALPLSLSCSRQPQGRRSAPARKLRSAVCRAGAADPGGDKLALPDVKLTVTSLRKLPKAQLEAMLQARGLDAAGNKRELVDRLFQALVELEPGADQPSEELVRLQSEKVSLESELRMLAANLQEASKARDIERDNLEQLTAQMSKMQSDWATDLARIKSLELAAARLEESESELTQLRSECDSFAARITSLISTLADKEQEIIALRSQLATANMARAAAAVAVPQEAELVTAGAAGSSRTRGGTTVPVGGGGSSARGGSGEAEFVAPSWQGLSAGLPAAVQRAAALQSHPIIFSPVSAPSRRPVGSKIGRSEPSTPDGKSAGVLQRAGTPGFLIVAGFGTVVDVWAILRRMVPEDKLLLTDIAVAAVAAAASAAYLA